MWAGHKTSVGGGKLEQGPVFTSSTVFTCQAEPHNLCTGL